MQYFVNLQRASLAVLLLLMSSYASAEIMKYEFSAVVDGLRGQFHTLNVGDTLSFDISFDNESGAYHQYIYDWGDKSELVCTSEEALTNNGCDIVSDNYDFQSNIEIHPSNFDHLIDLEAINSTGAKAGDRVSFEKNYVIGRKTETIDFFQVQLQNDFMNFNSILTSNRNIVDRIEFYHETSEGFISTIYDFSIVDTSFTPVSTVITDVNEPLSAALLSLGFLALLRRNIKKK